MAEGGDHNYHANSSSNDANNEPAPNQLKWIPSERGNKQPYLDGFLFKKVTTKNTTTYWTCREKECGASLKTFDDGTYLRGSKSHNHFNEHRVIAQRSKLRDELKQKAKDQPHQKLQSVYQEVVNEFADEDDPSEVHRARAIGKGLETFRGPMYKKRAETLPRLPQRRSDLSVIDSRFTQFTDPFSNNVYNILLCNQVVSLPNDSASSEELNTTTASQPLDALSLSSQNLNSQTLESQLLDSQADQLPNEVANADSSDEKRVIILRIEQHLKHLQETVQPNGTVQQGTTRIFADGTFKVAPKLFYQVYTVHARVRGQLFPILYSLLPDKESLTYEFMLNQVKDKLFEVSGEIWEPAEVQIDYESGMIAALKKVLPTTQIKGCFFHYCQAVVKRAFHLGLETYYVRANHTVRRIVRKCLTLPLVPLDRINNAMSIIEESVNSIEETHPFHNPVKLFIKYMKRTWVGDGTRQPLFPRTMWTQHNVFLDRTNNRLEAFHKNFKDSIQPHSNIWTFFSRVLTALHSDMDTIRNLSNSSTSRASSAEETDKNNRIAFFIGQFEHGSISLSMLMNNLIEVMD